jgi:hypothetical protein
MKTFALFLCLIATTADAAPLYLKCEGKEYSRDPSDAKPVAYSIQIDGTNVTVRAVTLCQSTPLTAEIPGFLVA